MMIQNLVRNLNFEFVEPEEGLYKTMLVNGRLRLIRFDQLNRDCQEGEIIPAGIVKLKQFVKRNW